MSMAIGPGSLRPFIIALPIIGALLATSAYFTFSTFRHSEFMIGVLLAICSLIALVLFLVTILLAVVTVGGKSRH
jgi:hypothetical protein